jgi:hypothetical protein
MGFHTLLIIIKRLTGWAGGKSNSGTLEKIAEDYRGL